MAGLKVYPLLMLLMARDYPTRIWVLDRDEKPSSAAILDSAARLRRWHSQGIQIDDCEGLTDVVDGQIAVVVSWKSLLTIRHEFAHASTTFLSPKVRSALEVLYRRALDQDALVEPLAGESLGEYVACAMSYCFFDDLREELAAKDLPLYRLVDGILRKADAISQQLI
ncbi:MAG: hypothetical protein HYX94_05835 [Chloroflexi bacterium]|nr:hypothetical protein [Chloroflexota bacterium]